MCGESLLLLHGWRLLGPSPRVRGIRGHQVRRATDCRSIPACAGNPRGRNPAGSPSQVHPRVCGESGTRRGDTHNVCGPSPRVRGIRRDDVVQRHRAGSIPACAGNPQQHCCCPIQCKVHPRVCGESLEVLAETYYPGGPSPRVRGIRGRQTGGRGLCGSIPACAGNPYRLWGPPA